MKRLNNITKKPWGKFQDLAQGNDWHLKILVLKKGRRISLQRHGKRSELWIVVEGRVKVQKGSEVHILSSQKTIFIKKKEVHRIQGLTDALVVEISFGSHQERDIVRLEDDYGRSKKKLEPSRAMS